MNSHWQSCPTVSPLYHWPWATHHLLVLEHISWFFSHKLENVTIDNRLIRFSTDASQVRSLTPIKKVYLCCAFPWDTCIRLNAFLDFMRLKILFQKFYLEVFVKTVLLSIHFIHDITKLPPDSNNNKFVFVGKWILWYVRKRKWF